ncbi:hypothetical protein H4R35_000304 [Dimargaris xerosporica]|nr:hypothetical protein H4R35_000304 [Dimargaris xerosporica]
MGGNANGQFGDYVLDANEFDNIISQIMEQQPSNHPLPASEASINNLQQSAVTAADLEETKECSICRDDFNVGENVVRLPCKHFFHDPCIKQWLRTNGTCPICRKRLDNAVGSPDSSSRPGQSSTSHARSSGPGPNHLVTSSNGHSTNSGSGGGGGGGSGGAGQWFPGAGMFFSAASNILSSTLAPAPASSQPPATSQPTTNSNTAPGQPAAATSSNTATSTGAWSTLVPLVSNLLQSLTSPHHASLASIHNLSANPAHSLTSRRSPPSSPPVGRGDHDPLRHLDDDVD